MSLYIPKPPLGSKLADIVMELEVLRQSNAFFATTHPMILEQLRNTLHTLEMLGSARIEGNNTTIVEYLEDKQQRKNDIDPQKIPESIREIINIEKAVEYCDESIRLGKPVNALFMNDVHKLVVAELSREGSGTPGTFRTHDVKIKNSSVVLSPWMQVPQHMEELFSLVTGEKSISIAMLKHVAAHHHYTVIHPYDNGNGRTARIFTYACLLRDGFSLVEKVINPTAVFCRSRNKYYDMLSRADSATEEGVTEWCFYVLEGMKDEFACIKKLADGSFVRKEIVSQVLSHAKMRNAISEREHSILSCAIQADEITLEKLEETIPNLSQGRYSQIGKELAERQLLREVRRGAYVISFDGPLLRGLIKALDAHNFLPMRDESIASV